MKPDSTQEAPPGEKYIYERFRDPENLGIVGDEVAEGDFILDCLLRNLGPLDGKTILDAGCGKGKFSRALQRNGACRVFGIDPSPAYLGRGAKSARAGGQARYLCGSISRLPLPDQSFDAVICSEVIEHIPDPDRALSEMARVLKPGGRILIVDKQIRALHTRYFVPVRLWKWWREKTGRWMYPAGAPFREIWYSPGELQKLMARRFVMQAPELLHAPGRSAFIFRRLPRWTWLYCCWKGTKPR